MSAPPSRIWPGNRIIDERQLRLVDTSAVYKNRFANSWREDLPRYFIMPDNPLTHGLAQMYSFYAEFAHRSPFISQSVKEIAATLKLDLDWYMERYPDTTFA